MVPVGELGRKGIHLERSLEVGSQSDHLGIGLTRLEESFSETAAGVFLSSVCIFLHDIQILEVSQCLIKLTQSDFALLVIRHAPMPLVRSSHEIHSVAHLGLEEDHDRFTLS